LKVVVMGIKLKVFALRTTYPPRESIGGGKGEDRSVSIVVCRD
jgi:hypothetical protein